MHQVLNDKDIDFVFRQTMPDLWTRVLGALRRKRLHPQHPEFDQKLYLTLQKYLTRIGSRPTPLGLFAGVGVGRVGGAAVEINRNGPNVRVMTFALDPYLLNDSYAPRADAWILNPTFSLREGFASYTRLAEANDSHESVTSEIPHQMLPFFAAAGQLQARSQAKSRQAWCAFVSGVLQLNSKDSALLLDRFLKVGLLTPACRESHITGGSTSRSRKLLRDTSFGSSLRNSKTSPAAGTEAGLAFLGQPIEVPEKIARHVLSVCDVAKAFSWTKGGGSERSLLWEAAETYLEKWHDHGPVPLTDMTFDALAPHLKSEASEQQPLVISRFLAQRLKDHQAIRGPSCSHIDAFWKLSGLDIETLSTSKRRPPVVAALIRTDSCLECVSLEEIHAHSASKLMGRFGGHHKNIRALIKEVQNKECLAEPATVFTELSTRYRRAIHRRLANRYSSLEKVIDTSGLADAGAIPIRDLGFYRSVDQEWTLINLKTRQRVEPLMTHRVNPNFDDHFSFKLLSHYSLNRGIDGPAWSWMGLERYFDFFPRVQIGSVIISRAKWVIRLSSAKAKVQELKDQITKLRPPLPSTVLISHSDMRLPVKTGSELFYSEILKSHRLSKFVILDEEPLSEADAIFESLVFGIDREPRRNFNSLTPVSDTTLEPVSYWKVLMDPELLGPFMKALAGFQSSKRLRFSYICFYQPEFQIRLRVFARTEAMLKSLNAEIVEWLKNMIEGRLIRAIQSAHYEPELDRWNEPEGLRFYQMFSELDSHFAVQEFKVSHDWNSEARAKRLVEVARDWLELLFPDPTTRMTFIKNRLGALSRSLKLDHVSADPFTAAIAKCPFPAADAKIFQKLKLTSLDKTKIREFTKFFNGLSPAKRFQWAGDIVHLAMNRRAASVSRSCEREVYRRFMRPLRAD